MHTRASLMYTELNMYSEQEKNIILSTIWQLMLTEMFALIDLDMNLVQLAHAHMTRRAFWRQSRWQRAL